jgi:hypothetical protein
MGPAPDANYEAVNCEVYACGVDGSGSAIRGADYAQPQAKGTLLAHEFRNCGVTALADSHQSIDLPHFRSPRALP